MPAEDLEAIHRPIRGIQDQQFGGLAHASYQRVYNAMKSVVTGHVGHVRFRLNAVSGPVGCHAVIDGTSGTAGDGIVEFTYTDRTAVLKTLTTGGNLHNYNPGCYGCSATAPRSPSAPPSPQAQNKRSPARDADTRACLVPRQRLTAAAVVAVRGQIPDLPGVPQHWAAACI